tara:strand:- start:115 stop:714 length:600 start_codon:yes stop_codon:yes gene_type:complete
MENNPQISVIICAYNEEKYIDNCLRSLMNQRVWFKFDIVIIDDCSTDNTISVLNEYANNIKLFKNEKNMGIGYSSNLGVKKSKTKYVIRVDADDYVSEHFLSSLYLFLESNSYANSVACDYYKVDKFGNILDRYNCLKDPIACGILYKKDDLIKIGLYDNKAKINEEKELELRYKKFFNKYRLEIPLYKYRIHENNTSG